jgi:hypothetical protein
MKRLISAIAIATLAAGGVAAAQEGPKLMGDLSRAEAKARAITTFDALDLNHDGKLDEADRTVRTQQMFDHIDTDHNGQISREEFAAARQHGGRGRDGTASADDRSGGRMWPHHGGMGRGPMMMHMAHMADANHDGAISKDEFIDAALKRFDAQDTNHDGIVTAAERQAAHKAMGDKWRARRGHHQGNMPPPASPPPPPAG